MNIMNEKKRIKKKKRGGKRERREGRRQGEKGGNRRSWMNCQEKVCVERGDREEERVEDLRGRREREKRDREEI